MCLPGFTVPVIDNAANLPVDGSLFLAIYKPQYGVSPVSNANAVFTTGEQRTGAKQVLLMFHGVTDKYSSPYGCTLWKNSTNGSGTPVAVNLPQSWMPVRLLVEDVNSSGAGVFYTEGYY